MNYNAFVYLITDIKKRFYQAYFKLYLQVQSLLSKAANGLLFQEDNFDVFNS